ncbi:hypothetical protein Ocin01_01863 [Orchesella cincta]|uniref:Uncharacterized protein n=1 Tax=Orchesella cincta TaxID=48709 RepID=A0A1D2NHJ5_ORCCI|nr:hypothetical protein Ocin01_01863 [Orchesella cincta]
MLEVEFYMDQLKSDSMLNYVITIVVRKFGRTVALKEISMTERKLFELFHLIQLKAAEISQSNVSPETVLGKLYAIIRNAANMDIFKIMELPTRTKYIRTISGIPQRLQWDAEGFVGFTVEKQDCSDVLGDNQNDPTCQLEFKPVFNMETSLSLGIGYPNAKHFSQEGFILQSNLSAELPLSLRLSRSTSNKENFIELVLPPLKKAFVKGGVQVLDMEASVDSIVQWNYKISLDGAHGPSSCPYSVDTDSNPVKIVLARNFERKALSLQVSDLQYEAVVELQSDPLYSIHGNLSYSPVVGSEPIRLYHFEVGAKNSDDVKRLQMKVSKRGHESSLDVYYIRKLQSVEGAATSQAWSCRAERRTGILCSWPFCMFCGEEYFIGATISTPRWKNIQLLEGSVSQVFPDQRIDIILKTKGIHPLHKAHFKTSITRAENTSSIHSPTLRVQVEKKLNEHKINETIQTDEENGGQWSFYSLSSEVFTELYGTAGASGIFVYSRRVSRYLDIYGAELSYPSRSSQQKATFLTTMYNPNETNANVTNSYIAETTFRSTQFPILDSDSKMYSRIVNSHSKKVLYAIRLINLTKGDIKLETLNSVNKDDATNSWANFHVDQTYKLFLPEGFLHRFIKARIALERIEQVVHEAALEVSVGVGQNGLEIRYDHIPDEDNALEILTSVTTSGDTYGLHHRLEPVRDAPGIGTNGDNDAAHAESMKFKYKGTYMFEDSSMKATGIFVARSGREILPFSKFDIRVSSVDGTDLGIRIFGAEMIQPETNIQNIKMNIQKGEIKVFEFKNEINPADEVPIKGTIYLKDYGEAKFFDNTKVSNRRNLQVKVKWPSKERLIQGRISFPTSLEEPLYLDLDVLVVSEVNEETVMKNAMELKNRKWEAGLECVFVKETQNYYDKTSLKKFYRKSNYTLLTYYIPPGLQRYLVEIQSQDYSARQKESYNYLFKAGRPDVTPLHIQLGLESDEKYKVIISYTDDHPEIERSATSILNKVSSLKVCHKDNFLYIFPKLEIDLFVQNFVQMEQNYTNYHSGRNEFTNIGKVGCSSVGIYLPLCNEINMSYKFNSEHADYYEGPWVANMTIENDNKNSDIDSLNLKLQANYETVREERKTTEDNNYGDFNMVTVFLSTVRADQLMKDSYNLDYNLRSRSADGENVNTKLVNGTYVFTKMFESLDFFEFSDEHQWSQLDNGNLYIWTNLVNHTTDINQTSESATFSSQYVSLGEEESSNNITWMQLRSTLDSNGFGLLKNIILQPTAFLNTYEGTVNADFLIKTEFSPVKTFRVLLSHDHNKSENEDDESSKYDTLSKLNVILNEREISCTNSLTAADGKIVGIGNTFNGECRSVDGVYEYVTVKTFVVCPKNVLDTSEDNLVHVDVSSSWTNEDDDDTEIRISNDIIYGPTTNGVMMARLAYFENSSEVDVGRNGSIFIYQNVANMEMTRELRLTETVISDSLNVLSFTQTSLQGISQQIVDDYFNVTNLNEVQTSDTTESGQVWVDYNIDVRSNIVNQGNSSNSHFKVKWLGFEERLFHCQSFYQTCSDNGINSTDNQIDTSNYCNLAIFPAKHVLYTLV